MKANVSVCIIARDEAPRLERLLPSIRDFVAEIIVIDTGSKDDTPIIASKYADKVVLYTACNNEDTGLIDDFSKARNFSLSFATQPWILWLDADDEVVGLENLTSLIKEYEKKYGNSPGYFMFPYEYAHDANGKCTLRHYRERLIRSPKDFKFINEVHEICVPNDPFKCGQLKRDSVIVKHNRSDKPTFEPARNLRILKKMYEKYGESEPRHLYYLGIEYANLGDFPNGIKFLERYAQLSGWDDEKCLALMKMCDVCRDMGDIDKMINTAHRAVAVKPSWGEPYFYLAKGHYTLASNGKNAAKNWPLCVQYAQFGLMLPPTETVLFINPLDRQVDVHRYLNVALNAIGKTKEALASVDEALKFVPDDTQLLNNRNFYLATISREAINKSLGTLKELNAIPSDIHEKTINLLDGKVDDASAIFTPHFRSPDYPKDISKEHFPVALSSPHAQAWAVPSAFEFDDLPVQLTDEQLQAVVLLVWKQYISNNEILSALHFLDNAPHLVRHTFATEQALKATRDMISDTPASIEIDGKVAISNHSYEKLTDPINQLMLPIKTMIEPDGKLILTTTNGSGNKDEIWASCKDGTSWLSGKKDVISAPTTQSIVNQLRQAGYHVSNAFPVGSDISVEASLVAPSSYKLDIVFWIGDGLEIWTPETLKTVGMGASETLAADMARRLVDLGHRVRLYVGCGNGEGIYDGVEYIRTEKFKDVQCDVLIVSRYADVLSEDVKCKMKLLWCHDLLPINRSNKRLLEAYRILALSGPHKEHILKECDLHPDHILVTRNGIDLKRFDKVMPRNRFRAINSSSPDRSWLFLFDCWPLIKAKVPQAELHLYYGFENWEKYAKIRGDMKGVYHYKYMVKEMEKHGVVFHGRVSKEVLADEMLSSGVWLHPTNFFESSCVSAMEVQAAGLRMVTSNLGALKETAGNRAVLIDGNPSDEEYQAKFVDAAVASMLNEDDSDRLFLQKHAKEHFCLDALAKDWDVMIYDLLDKSAKFPMVPYQPTIRYRQEESVS